MAHKKLSTVLIILSLLLACGGDPTTARKKLLDTGNGYFERGKYREAALIYQRAIQKDRRFGEAYYRLGLAELKTGRYSQAFRALHRATELQPSNSDAYEKLADIYLAIRSGDARRDKQLLTDLRDLTDRAERHQVYPQRILRVRGFLAMAEEDADGAIEYFRQALETDPTDQKVTLALAGALNARREFEETEKISLAAIENDRSFGPIYDLLYLAYVKQGRDGDAEALILRKCDNNPKTSTFWLQLAGHYHRTKQPDKRDETLRHLTGNPSDFPTAPMEVGGFFMRLSDYDRAIQQFEAGVQRYPDQKGEYRFRIAEVLASQDRMAEALRVAEQVLEEDPDNDRARVLHGALRIQGGDPEAVREAIEELESVVPRMRDNAVLRYSLGRAYFTQGNLDRALVEFQEAARLRSDYVPPRIAMGAIYLVKDQPATAAQLAEEVLKIYPRNLPGRLMRSNALLDLREYNQARQAIETILSEYPSSRDAQFLLATLNFRERKYKDAERILRGLHEASPQDSRGMTGLVQVYVAQGRPDLAQQVLGEEIEKAPDSLGLRMANANVAVQAENYDQAIAEYDRILVARPNSDRVHLQMGTAHYKAGDFTQAETHYRKASELNPKNLTANLRLALLLGEVGRKEETTALLREILTMAPDNPYALNNLAYLLSESPENLDTALSLVQRAVSRAPDIAKIADTLGWIYLKKNLSDSAIQVYRDLVTKHPSHPTWRYHYAMALFQKGDQPEARNQLRKALENYPSEEEETKIRKLLSQIDM